MQLSTKGRYAVMALVDIAGHTPGECVPLQEVALNQKLSVDYLEQLFMKLRRAGLITSMRGPGGGYRLARNACDISIADIMTAVDEPVKMTRCDTDDDPGCLGDARCATHDLWHALSDHIVEFLRDASLKDVVDGKFRDVPDRKFSGKGACADYFMHLAFDPAMALRVVA